MAGVPERLAVGIDLPPWFVAALRAVVLAAVTAGIGAALNYAEIVDWKDYAWAAPIVIGGLRQAEGFFDQMTSPHQNDS